MNFPKGVLPILPLRNTVIYPGLTQVLKVGRERSLNALKFAEKNGYWIVAALQKTDFVEAKEQSIGPEHVHLVGTICRIESIKGSPDSSVQLVVRGVSRMQINDLRLDDNENYLHGECFEMAEINDMNSPTEAVMLESLKKISIEILKLIPTNTDQIIELVNGVSDLTFLTHLCSGNIELDFNLKQRILETIHLKDRCLLILSHLKEMKEGLEVQAEIRNKLNQKLGQVQRQSILREHLKTIKQELGEGQDGSAEDKFSRKIEEADLPEEVRKVAETELQRLNEIGPQSPESHIIRNYLELLVALPWSKRSDQKELNLDEAKAILNQDHYGLDKVKKRIVQQLAMMKIKKNTKGTILLFLGPPGVGKTSLGQSIARALGRKFVRVSFGGVRDDADVRGHRRTYIGAMPGRIISGLKKAGEKNPVFLLDEVDKMSRSFHGDPGAALLEVLDPEQNVSFVDHYLDLGFDLSEVVFIATANQLDTIPAPLLDRMEIIELTGYTTAEKLHIAKNHLIPKQIKEMGLPEGRVEFSDEALIQMISHYTREAGVRELQRQINSALRSISEKLVKALESPEENSRVRIELSDLEEVLGNERFQLEVADILSQPGVATGLAWSPSGGSILHIECTQIPGKGELIVTGQLGEVMKESTQLAWSLVKNFSTSLKYEFDISKNDIHVHVPAGAVPKDGPSAGVALLTSLMSLLLKRPVKPLLAMTGEITLRGTVLPVGGIKEKVIAAHRAGVREVILPKKNEKDVKEVPQEVTESLKIIYVDSVSAVLEHALAVKLGSDNQIGINHVSEAKQSDSPCLP